MNRTEEKKGVSTKRKHLDVSNQKLNGENGAREQKAWSHSTLHISGGRNE